MELACLFFILLPLALFADPLKTVYREEILPGTYGMFI
jgi:hypothetical protein